MDKELTEKNILPISIDLRSCKQKDSNVLRLTKKRKSDVIDERKQVKRIQVLSNSIGADVSIANECTANEKNDDISRESGEGNESSGSTNAINANANQLFKISDVERSKDISMVYKRIENDDHRGQENDVLDNEVTLTTERHSQPDQKANKERKVLYRLLRSDEDYKCGIKAKNPISSVSLSEHIERGSRGLESRYISCTKTLNAIRILASLPSRKIQRRNRDVVEIDITELENMEIYDLTTEVERKKYLIRDSNAWEYAVKFDEVVINPGSMNRIDPKYIKLIGYVHKKTFIETSGT